MSSILSNTSRGRISQIPKVISWLDKLSFYFIIDFMVFWAKSNWRLFSIILLSISAGWIVISSMLLPLNSNSSLSFARDGFLAPEIELESLNGEIVRLNNYYGHVVVVNFWATWCLPCRAEMPALERVNKEFSSYGVVILGINVTASDTVVAVSKFVSENEITFPILLDMNGDISRNYLVNAMPTTYFIDTHGRITDTVVGGPMTEALLISKIQELLP